MFFFFQAEDGIRDIGVTGVQTCALPIFATNSKPNSTWTLSNIFTTGPLLTRTTLPITLCLSGYSMAGTERMEACTHVLTATDRSWIPPNQCGSKGASPLCVPLPITI